MQNNTEICQSNKDKKRAVCTAVVGGILCICYGVLCTYLYYMQSLKLDDYLFESDLPYHISMAVEDHWGYSLTAYIYCFFDLFKDRNILVAMFLSLCTILTLIVTYLGIRDYLKCRLLTMALTVLSGFVMPYFVSSVCAQRYIGYQSPSIWHNSTYIVMKLLAVIACFYYWKHVKPSGEGLNVKRFIVFSLFLALTTATKTSFIVVFAPALIIEMFVDLWRGVPFKRLFALGMTMFPSLIVILIQNVILFGDDNGIIFKFGYTLYLHTDKAPITMILSALFPVLVFLANIVPFTGQLLSDIKEIRKFRKQPDKKERELPNFRNRYFWGSWLVWLFGALEIMFLCETGERADAANFAWGYYFALFLVFLISMILWVRNLKDKSFAGGKLSLKCIYGLFTGWVLIQHGVCGFIFFYKLLQGTSYFM